MLVNSHYVCPDFSGYNRTMATQDYAQERYDRALIEEVDLWLVGSSRPSSPSPTSDPSDSHTFGVHGLRDENSLATPSTAYLSQTSQIPGLLHSEQCTDIDEKMRYQGLSEIWKTTLKQTKFKDCEPVSASDASTSEPKSACLPELHLPSTRVIRRRTDDPHSCPSRRDLDNAHLQSLSTSQITLISLQKQQKNAKKSQKAKKHQEKPEIWRCFLCFETVPYKIKLISHLKQVHGIERSQSLMYKRLNQGEDVMRRLYVKERKTYRK